MYQNINNNLLLKMIGKMLTEILFTEGNNNLVICSIEINLSQLR